MTPISTANRRRWLASWCAVFCVPAIFQVLELGRILAGRIAYPYDVHWMDGGTLLHAHRLLNGQPVYPELTGSAGFLANPYPPVLYATLAAIGAIFGLDYTTGRVVAILATGLSGALLARAVYVKFRPVALPWVFALLALGAMAAGFPVSGGWYDATMTDPLALAIAIGCAETLATAPAKLEKWRLVMTPLLMVMTIFTKQTYAALVAWQLVFLCRSNLRQGVLVALSVALSTALLIVVAQKLTHGSFLQYVAWQPLRHPSDSKRIWDGAAVISKFAPYIPLLLFGGLVLAVKRALSPSTLLWTGMLVAAFPVALVPYSKMGGWDNDFMPIVMLAPAAALCMLSDVCRLVRAPKQEVLFVLCALGSALYLLLRRYPHEAFTADPQRRAAAASLNDFIAGMHGDVLIPARPFLAIRQGARVEQIHIMPWYDALLAGRLDLSFDDFIRRTRPRYVVLSDQEPAVIVEALAHDYFLNGRVPPETWPAQTLEGGIKLDPNPSVPSYPGQLQWVLERNRIEPEESRCLFEFESKGYDGWTPSGNAFGSGPTEVDSQRGTALFAAQGTVVGVVGRAFASSLATADKDAATGALESRPFALDRKILMLRVAGGAAEKTRVELRVDGQVRHTASGRGNNYLEQVSWNVSGDHGREARLFVIDDDATSHVMIDHVCLVDDPAPRPL